jgi:hypothetical protein
MVEVPENGKESSHYANGNGLNECMCVGGECTLTYVTTHGMELPKLMITCIFIEYFTFKKEHKFEKNIRHVQSVCNHQNTTISIKDETSNCILMKKIHSERISTSIFLWILLHIKYMFTELRRTYH